MSRYLIWTKSSGDLKGGMEGEASELTPLRLKTSQAVKGLVLILQIYLAFWELGLVVQGQYPDGLDSKFISAPR